MADKLTVLIGDLLDAWEDVPNDEKKGMSPWLDKLGEKVEAISQLIDEPYSPPLPTDKRIYAKQAKTKGK